MHKKSDRKKDHIELALSLTHKELRRDELDLYYEPMLGIHPDLSFTSSSFKREILGKEMKYPLWISSMTGGTPKSASINERLAMICKEFSLGMGLGSIRPLLALKVPKKRWDEFLLRPILGPTVPFVANLGIAQVEEIVTKGDYLRLIDVMGRLETDGLFVHVNPLQELLQPEGDTFKKRPIDTIEALLTKLEGIPIMVKEVGQGMGPKSLSALLDLPIKGLELAGLGGTNFTQIEATRGAFLEKDKNIENPLSSFQDVGHTASEMLVFLEEILQKKRPIHRDFFVIISGGIKNAIQAYDLMNKSSLPSLYGVASRVLKPAMAKSYSTLQEWTKRELYAYAAASQFLKAKQLKDK